MLQNGFRDHGRGLDSKVKVWSLSLPNWELLRTVQQFHHLYFLVENHISPFLFFFVLFFFCGPSDLTCKCPNVCNLCYLCRPVQQISLTRLESLQSLFSSVFFGTYGIEPLFSSEEVSIEGDREGKRRVERREETRSETERD